MNTPILKAKKGKKEICFYNDGEAALKYAHHTLGYTDKEIYIFGRSLGTTVATHISQNRDRCSINIQNESSVNAF